MAPTSGDRIVEIVLEHNELSLRDLAVRFTGEKRYFVSEATVYRRLRTHDLIASPTFVGVKAAEVFSRDLVTSLPDLIQAPPRAPQ